MIVPDMTYRHSTEKNASCIQMLRSIPSFNMNEDITSTLNSRSTHQLIGVTEYVDDFDIMHIHNPLSFSPIFII